MLQRWLLVTTVIVTRKWRKHDAARLVGVCVSHTLYPMMRYIRLSYSPFRRSDILTSCDFSIMSMAHRWRNRNVVGMSLCVMKMLLSVDVRPDEVRLSLIASQKKNEFTMTMMRAPRGELNPLTVCTRES